MPSQNINSHKSIINKTCLGFQENVSQKCCFNNCIFVFFFKVADNLGHNLFVELGYSLF